jgi:hypothetical protein
MATKRKVTGLTTTTGVRATRGASARVGPKVAAPSDFAANAAETVSSTAKETVGSTARTAAKTVGSMVQGAARTVGFSAGGVAFSSLVAKAMLVLGLIKRIALLVIEAIRDRARRLRERYGIDTDQSTNHSTEAEGQRAEPVPMWSSPPLDRADVTASRAGGNGMWS